VTVNFAGTFTFKNMDPNPELDREKKRQALEIIQRAQHSYNEKAQGFETDEFDYTPPVESLVWEGRKGTLHVELARRFIASRFIEILAGTGIGKYETKPWPRQKHEPELDIKILNALDKKHIPYQYSWNHLSACRHMAQWDPRPWWGSVSLYFRDSMSKLYRFQKGVSGVQPIPLDEYLASPRNNETK
jgi:hypothetical protein